MKNSIESNIINDKKSNISNNTEMSGEEVFFALNNKDIKEALECSNKAAQDSREDYSIHLSNSKDNSSKDDYIKALNNPYIERHLRKKVLAEVQFDNKGIQKVENKKKQNIQNSIFHFNKKLQQWYKVIFNNNYQSPPHQEHLPPLIFFNLSFNVFKFSKLLSFASLFIKSSNALFLLSSAFNQKIALLCCNKWRSPLYLLNLSTLNSVNCVP